MGRSCVRSWHAHACVRGPLHSQLWHVFYRTPCKVSFSYCALGGGSPACPAVAPAALAMGTPWPATGNGTRTLTRTQSTIHPHTTHTGLQRTEPHEHTNMETLARQTHMQKGTGDQAQTNNQTRSRTLLARRTQRRAVRQTDISPTTRRCIQTHTDTSRHTTKHSHAH